LGEPGWGLIGFEAGADALTGIGEGTTHDLDDASTAEIDAGSEHGVKLRGRAMAH
jgi:ferric-dicitrate binding protein FerR (iron transport regulator)